MNQAPDRNEARRQGRLSATAISSHAGSAASAAATTIVWPSRDQLIRPGIASARWPRTTTDRGLILGGQASEPPLACVVTSTSASPVE